MKKILYAALLCALFTMGCKEDEKLLFNEKARAELVSENQKAPADHPFSFVWGSDTRVRDTVFIPIRVIGGSAPTDRHVLFEQVSEYIVDYTYDNKGYIIDSTVTERTDKAIPGTHYVPLNDESIRPLFTIKAGRVKDSVGIVVLRDASLKKASVRLRLRLKENEDFALGERRLQEQTIIISDKLEMPSNWNYTTKAYLGNYSAPKHRLMMQVVGGKVDDAWIAEVNKSQELIVYWRGKFIEALEAFNSNPANIASGLAPMREDPTNASSPLVTFPSRV